MNLYKLLSFSSAELQSRAAMVRRGCAQVECANEGCGADPGGRCPDPAATHGGVHRGLCRCADH